MRGRGGQGHRPTVPSCCAALSSQSSRSLCRLSPLARPPSFWSSIITRFPPCEQSLAAASAVGGARVVLGRPRPRPCRCYPLVCSVPAIVIPRPRHPLPGPHRCRPRVPAPVSSWFPSLLSLPCPGPGCPVILCRPPTPLVRRQQF